MSMPTCLLPSMSCVMLFKGQDTEMAKEVEQNAQDLDRLLCHIKEKN